MAVEWTGIFKVFERYPATQVAIAAAATVLTDAFTAQGPLRTYMETFQSRHGDFWYFLGLFFVWLAVSLIATSFATWVLTHVGGVLLGAWRSYREASWKKLRLQNLAPDEQELFSYFILGKVQTMLVGDARRYWSHTIPRLEEEQLIRGRSYGDEVEIDPWVRDYLERHPEVLKPKR